MSESWKNEPPAGGGSWPFACCNRQGGLVVAAALAAIGIFFTTVSLTLTFGDLELPGPGFLPFALGLLLIALSVAIFAMALKEPRGEVHIELGHMPVLIAFAAMAGAAFLFERIGAYLSLGAFCIVMLVFVARMHVIPAVLSSAVGMLAVWYVFKVLLGVQLPAGPLAGIL